MYQFNQLKREDQFKVLWDKGIFLNDRTDDYRFALYQIEAFYIEVKYDSLVNEIVGLRTFLSTTPLQPYLEKMTIPKLLY